MLRKLDGTINATDNVELQNLEAHYKENINRRCKCPVVSVYKKAIHMGRSSEVPPLERTPCSSRLCTASKMPNGLLVCKEI